MQSTLSRALQLLPAYLGLSLSPVICHTGQVYSSAAVDSDGAHGAQSGGLPT